MDVDKILSGAIRFSNFMTVRLVFCGFLVWTLVPSASFSIDPESVLDNLPLVENAVKSYEKTIEALGIADAAIYLLLFVLITVIHLIYSLAVWTGKHIPISLVFPSLTNLERNIVFEISDWMQGKIEATDKRASALKKIQGLASDINEIYKTPIQSAQEVYRVFKFLVVYLPLIYWFGHFGPAGSSAGAYLPQIWLVCCGACILAGLRLRNTSYNAYSQLLSRVDEAITPEAAPHADRQQMAELSTILRRHGALFRTRPDLNIPMLGSARVLYDQYNGWLRRSEK